MATTQTFGGGVHPREIGNGKNATQSQQIVNAAAPARVMIAMAQHAGAPAVCCVKVGQTVNMGQIIGEAQGFISAPVHASVSGKVVAITTCTVASGKSVPAVVIDNDFEDRWDESVKPCDNVDALSAADIASIAARCGIVGMGGAAFPTNVKLDTSKLEEKPDTLIVNGSECEPYLTSDHRIMVENAEQIVDGIALAMKASGVACAKVGIEDNKPDAIAAMREAASGKQNIEVVSLPARYPQGFEKTLIYSLTGRIVPNGKLPSAAKCVVMNVGTCAALSAAGQPGQLPRPHRCAAAGSDRSGRRPDRGRAQAGCRRRDDGQCGSDAESADHQELRRFPRAGRGSDFRRGIRLHPLRPLHARLPDEAHAREDRRARSPRRLRRRDCRRRDELHGMRKLHVRLPGQARAYAELPRGQGDRQNESQKVLIEYGGT